jgi:hypothetical protein
MTRMGREGSKSSIDRASVSEEKRLKGKRSETFRGCNAWTHVSEKGARGLYSLARTAGRGGAGVVGFIWLVFFFSPPLAALKAAGQQLLAESCMQGQNLTRSAVA